MLPEFEEVALQDESIFLRIPASAIEIVDFTAKFFGISGCFGMQNLLQHDVVTKKPRFASHHPVFGGGISDTVEGKRAFPPLAEAAFADTAIVFGAMAPEKQVFDRAELPLGLNPGNVVFHLLGGWNQF